MAEKYYGVSSLSISMLSMSYMIMFIIFSMPASYVIDKFGYRYSLIIGALLTAVFGLIRALYADNFTIVLISQFIIAVGQPFLLNISTKVPANWFPISERSTAAGILIMAQYIGFAVPMVLSPSIAEKSGIPKVFMIFAIIAIISAFLAIAFTKEKPKIAPPGPNYESDEINKGSLKGLFKNKPYLIALFICFISMGIFNTILLPRGITSVQAGVIGAVFVIAGIIGAALLPIISDKIGVRIPVIITAVILLTPLYIGLTFINGFVLLCIIAGAAGFTVMGVAPILFQHGSEVAYPIKEGTSLGVILLMGQISGALFVYVFESISSAVHSVTLPMILIVALTAVQIPFAMGMKESKFVTKK